MRPLLRNLLIVLLATVPALPAGAADAWSLEKAVPDGVYLYVHTTKNPENEFLEAYWDKVFEAFWNVGLLDEVKGLIATKMSEVDRADFQAKWDRFADLIGQVEWGELFGNEFIYAQAMRFPTPTHLYLFRMDKELADKNVTGLKAILQELVTLVGNEKGGPLTFSESELYGAKVWTLQLGDEMAIGLAQRGDIIVATARTASVLTGAEGQEAATPPGSSQMFEKVLQLLNGDKSVKRLIDRRNYRQAMAALPKPENERFFFDAGSLFAGIEEGLKWIQKEAVPESDRAETGQWFRAIAKAIDHFKVIDCCASVEITEGYSTRCYDVTMMAPEAKDKPLYKAFCGTPPVQQFDKYVPKKATGFSVSSGVDWMALYEAITGYVRDELPGGQEKLATWDALQEQMGFHIEQDLLSWMGHEMIAVSMPAAIPSPFGGEDWVLMMKVKDQAKAKSMVDAGLAQLNAVIASKPQLPPLTTQPAKQPALEGFVSVTHPMFMMFLRPVYGFADGYMIIGSSETAISRCLKTGRGEGPSVRQNKRFAKEGLTPQGPIASISFADKSKMGQEIAQVLGMLGMVGGMLPMPPDDEGAQLVRTVFGMLQKLAPVAAQIDFYKSEASVTTFDGKMYRTEKVTHYKEPPPPEPPATETAGAVAD